MGQEDENKPKMEDVLNEKQKVKKLLFSRMKVIPKVVPSTSTTVVIKEATTSNVDSNVVLYFCNFLRKK